MDKEKRLTKSQAQLLAALQAGGKLHYAPYKGRFNPSAYYYCWELPRKRCTVAALGLIAKGMVKMVGDYNHTFELTDAGRAWKPIEE